MAHLATPSFLGHLKSLYPHKRLQNFNPWYIIAAVSFCASNEPEAVPHVFRHALKDLRAGGASAEERLLLARKVRDALFKARITCGYPRAINSLLSLHKVMPEELRDTMPMRRLETPLQKHEQTGRAVFRSIYGETADSVQASFNNSYPDLGWFTNTICYGLMFSVIASGSPRQMIQWHLNGPRRTGATLEEIQAVRKIAMEVASAAGINWKNGVPEVKDLVDDVA